MTQDDFHDFGIYDYCYLKNGDRTRHVVLLDGKFYETPLPEEIDPPESREDLIRLFVEIPNPF